MLHCEVLCEKPTQHLANRTLACYLDMNTPILRPCSVTVPHGAAMKGHGGLGSAKRGQEAGLGRRGCWDQAQVQTYRSKVPRLAAAQSWLPLTKTAKGVWSTEWGSIP